jgi:hypothetical protein
MKSILTQGALALAAMVLVGFLPEGFAAPEQSAASKTKQAPSVKSEQQGREDLSGVVVETVNTGGYTYVCLEKNGKRTWAAVPEMKATVGAQLSLRPGQEMVNFTSKTLNRTFDRIVFSEGIAGSGKNPAGGPATAQAGQTATGSKAQASPKDAAIKVEKAAGANAYTVAEVYAKRSALDAKTVSVKGKVVKVSKNIMGRNWVHLQDGSGDQNKGTHNLVVTTQDLPSVGDVVTMTGTLAKDKDFGAGYRYEAIVEDATIKK